jgi:hypothetical protein
MDLNFSGLPAMQLARQPGFWRYAIEVKPFVKRFARAISFPSCRTAVSNWQLSTLKCRWADTSIRTSLGDCYLVAGNRSPALMLAMALENPPNPPR